MKKSISISLVIVLIISFSSCSVKNDLFTKQIDRNGINLIVMEESSKITYLKDDKTLEKFCASREIDSVKTYSEGIGLGLSNNIIGESISEEDGTGAVALGGRSPAVLITREMMFRACELALNLNLNSKETIEIYRMFMDYTTKLVKDEQDIGSNPIVSLPIKIDNKITTSRKNDSENKKTQNLEEELEDEEAEQNSNDDEEDTEGEEDDDEE